MADEAVSNIRTVRAFAMEDQEQELFDTEAELSMVLNERLGVGIGWFQAGTNMFLNGTVLATLYMGGYLLSTEKLSAGQLMAYLMASQTIQRSLAQISLLFGAVIKGLAAGSRVFEVRGVQCFSSVLWKSSEVLYTSYPTRFFLALEKSLISSEILNFREIFQFFIYRMNSSYKLSCAFFSF